MTLPSGLKQYQHVSTANGIYSASDKRVHFGLGSETAVKTAGNTVAQRDPADLENIKADQILKIIEPEK